jgi:hypothetical protein
MVNIFRQNVFRANGFPSFDLTENILYFCFMSKINKTIGLFFAAMLVFLSISAENSALLLTSQYKNSQSDNSSSYFSSEKANLFFLNRQEEKLVSSVRNLPVPSLKNHINDFQWNCLLTEVKISSINSEYLSYSVTVDPNFTSHDIIFPFHYFW